MKDLYSRFFKESMVGVVVAISAITFLGLLYLIPHLTKEKSVNDAYNSSEQLTTYIRMFRGYYAANILKKIKSHTDLKANYDHKSDEKTVPLPATLIHDLGAIFTEQTDTHIQMYSNYPFPNRSTRVLDRFQQDALAYILKNPGESFSREENVDGKSMYRTAFGDYLFAESCVSCHNTRADTPKNDWKLGDMRGVIEVSVPLENDIGSNKGITFSILLFMVINFLFLALYYFIQMKKRNKKLEKNFSSTDKILSEYKRAVDLGAIVSKADLQGKISYVNEAFVEISGYAKHELLGKQHNLVRHPDTPSEVFVEMWNKILNKQVWQGDLKNRKKDGSTYFVYVTIIPILDEHNKIVEFLAIRYNTTSLHEAISRANSAEKAKGDFLANMSHELRTPLNAIIGFSQILLRKKNLDAKEVNYVQKIHVSGENLLVLVNSILDFSKFEEGEMEFSPSQVSLVELFHEINILLETQIANKNITLEVRGLDTKKSIQADKQLLKQALVNILSNAVKFTSNEGNITVSYEFKDEKNVFTICDDGIGMSTSDLNKLFEPFKQGSSSRNAQVTGTGLGLAITKKIIEDLHNGKLEVTSEVNKGTCFSIYL